MSLQFQFDESSRILLVRLEGQLTDEAAIECYEAVQAYALEKSVSAGIVDLSGITGFPVSSQLLRQLARRRPEISGDMPRVIVAPNIVAYGLLRMFQLVADRHRPNFHVVRSLDQAVKLLQIESPEFHSTSLRRYTNSDNAGPTVGP